MQLVHFTNYVSGSWQVEIYVPFASRYEVPSGRSFADACRLHAQVYVLAERLCIDDLKAMALQKMSSALEPSSWFAPNRLEPTTIVELLKIVYDWTRDVCRWTMPSRNKDERCKGSNMPVFDSMPGEGDPL